MAVKSSKTKKINDKNITDEMIGMDDRICRCSSIVGDIILDRNKKSKNKASLKKIMDSMKTEKNRK